MRKLKKRYDWYILTLVAEKYSLLSDGRVVGTVDVAKVKFDNNPYLRAFTKEITWSLQVTSRFSNNSKSKSLAHTIEHAMWASNLCLMQNYC